MTFHCRKSSASWRKKMFGVSLLGGLTAGLSACSPSPSPIEDPPGEIVSELITRLSGASIASPNVSKTKTYLSVRSINTLESLGALSGALATLAERVDGVIGAKPADGRFSVDEILRIETPDYIKTLFPDEKAALPKLWALLETTNATGSKVTIADLAPFVATDQSTAVTVPIKPKNLAITALPAALQTTAQRLELAYDSDSNSGTVTEADLDGAIAAPDPWTAEEIAEFQAIKQLFIALAGTTLHSIVAVPAPTMTTKTVATWGTATVQLTQGIEYGETRGATFFRSDDTASLDASLFAHRVSQATVSLTAGQSLVFIDETTEAEQIIGSGDLTWPTSGRVTVEVWSAGTRLGSYRATMPVVSPVDQNVDLTPYLDYSLVAGGKPLIKNVTAATVNRTTYYTQNLASYAFQTTAQPLPAGADTSALAILATPKSSLPPGRYEVSVPALGTGTCKLDLSPEGVVSFTRPGGATIRSYMYIWSHIEFDADYSDRLRGLFDPSKNELNIFFDGGGSLSDTTITGTSRTG